MIILAMDLSLSSPAFAVIEHVKHEKPIILHLSSIKTNAKKSHGYRLFQIYNHLKEIYEEFEGRINFVVSEKGFSRHARTTQILYMVHGVARVISHMEGFEVEELSPTTVKAKVGGSGKASKEQLADAVRGFFLEELTFKNDDESDAVAVGLCFLIDKGVLS
jgi:crossover junction endodeoxyribonuclease RuvC